MNDQINGVDPQALLDQAQALADQEFATLADQARKVTEGHIATLSAGATAQTLPSFSISLAILFGVASSTVTALVGMCDQAEDDRGPELLNAMVDQMASVWNQIQDRKSAEAAAAAQAATGKPS